MCKSSEKLDREILERCFNLLSKLLKNADAQARVLGQKHTMFKMILFFHSEFGGDLQMNCLRCIHPLVKLN